MPISLKVRVKPFSQACIFNLKQDRKRLRISGVVFLRIASVVLACEEVHLCEFGENFGGGAAIPAR